MRQACSRRRHLTNHKISHRLVFHPLTLHEPETSNTFNKCSYNKKGPTQPPVQWVLGLFPGGKEAGTGSHIPSFRDEVKEIVVLHLCSSSGPSRSVIGRTLPISQTRYHTCMISGFRRSINEIPTGSPETPVINHQSTLSNIPEELRFRGGNNLRTRLTTIK